MKNSLSSLSQPRILIPVGMIAVLLVGFAFFFARQSSVQQTVFANPQLPIQNDGTTVVNGYQVPEVENWNRETTSPTNNFIQSVMYSTTVDETKLMMKFVLFQTPSGSPADTAEDLAKSVQQADDMSKKMNENKQTQLSQATQYRGHPAYLTRTIVHRNGIVIEAQILRVADGKNLFWFFQSLSGKQIAPAAREAASKAWQGMTSGLKTN